MSGVVLTLFTIVFLAVSIHFALQWHRVKRRLDREAYIRSFTFPLGAVARVRNKYPHLDSQDMDSVTDGLRHFFLAHLKSDCSVLAMPSQVASDLWHEFVRHEREYLAFAEKAFGRMLHHVPAAKPDAAQSGHPDLHRCWRYVCREENIDPDAPSRLPLLFALDGNLNIESGVRYRVESNGFRHDDTSTGRT